MHRIQLTEPKKAALTLLRWLTCKHPVMFSSCRKQIFWSPSDCTDPTWWTQADLFFLPCSPETFALQPGLSPHTFLCLNWAVQISLNCPGSWLSHRRARASCSRSAWGYLMSKALRHHRWDMAKSCHVLSSAPGANKGDFLHIWLSPMFLGRQAEKKREEGMHLSYRYLPFHINSSPLASEAKQNYLSFPVHLPKGKEARSRSLPEIKFWGAHSKSSAGLQQGRQSPPRQPQVPPPPFVLAFPTVLIWHWFSLAQKTLPARTAWSKSMTQHLPEEKRPARSFLLFNSS